MNAAAIPIKVLIRTMIKTFSFFKKIAAIKKLNEIPVKNDRVDDKVRNNILTTLKPVSGIDKNNPKVIGIIAINI